MPFIPDPRYSATDEKRFQTHAAKLEFHSIFSLLMLRVFWYILAGIFVTRCCVAFS